MGILNDNDRKILKLQYDLFNKSDQRVYFKIVKVDNGKFSFCKSGYIKRDGSLDLLESDFGPGEFNSSSHFADRDGFDVQLYFNVDVDLHFNQNKNQYYINSSSKSIILHDKYDSCKKEEIIEISNEEAIIPNNGKFYMVVIYPNNYIAAMIRIYRDLDFDLLDVEDRSAIYNSYINKVSIKNTNRVVQESVERYSDIPISKYKDHLEIQKVLDELSHESIENNTYYNELNNTAIGEEIVLRGINFSEAWDKINTVEKILTFNLNESDHEPLHDLCNALNELNWNINSSISYKHIDNIYHISEARWSAIIVDNLAIACEYDGERPLARSGQLLYIDLNNLNILSSCKISVTPPNDNARSNMSVKLFYNIETESMKNYDDYTYEIEIPYTGMIFYRNPLDFVKFIESKLLSGNILKYFYKLIPIIMQGKFQTFSLYQHTVNILKLHEDDKDYLLLRGPLGELLKKEI